MHRNKIFSISWSDNPILHFQETLSICPVTAITEPYIPELELN